MPSRSCTLSHMSTCTHNQDRRRWLLPSLNTPEPICLHSPLCRSTHFPLRVDKRAHMQTHYDRLTYCQAPRTLAKESHSQRYCLVWKPWNRRQQLSLSHVGVAGKLLDTPVFIKLFILLSSLSLIIPPEMWDLCYLFKEYSLFSTYHYSGYFTSSRNLLV